MRIKQCLFLMMQVSTFAGICSVVCGAQTTSEIGKDQAVKQRTDALVKQMTLDEKLQFIVSKYPNNAVPGGGAGYIEGIRRLNIPDMALVQMAPPCRLQWHLES